MGWPARVPRPRAVRKFLEDRRALPDQYDGLRPDYLCGSCRTSCRCRHLDPEADDHGRRSAAGGRSSSLQGSHRSRAVPRVRPHRGNVCQCARLARISAPRLGRPAAALPRGSHRRDRRRHGRMDLSARERDWNAGPAWAQRLRRLRCTGPLGDRVCSGRKGARRLARHGRPSFGRRERIHPVGRPCEGPHYSRWPQHRPCDDRGRITRES